MTDSSGGQMKTKNIPTRPMKWEAESSFPPPKGFPSNFSVPMLSGFGTCMMKMLA